MWARSFYNIYEANYLLNPDENACSKSYSLLMNTTVRLRAFSSSYCTININSSLNFATWHVIEIYRREGNPHYSNFFVENFLEEDSDNSAHIVSFPFGDCEVKLRGKSLTFHLVMTYIDINIHNFETIITTYIDINIHNLETIITKSTLKQNPCGVIYDGVE